MAIVYSYVFVFVIIGASSFLVKIQFLDDEGGRKFIHIGVGNWIILGYFIFDNLLLAIIPPFSFIILNYISYHFDVIKAMERDKKSSNDLGTVYYAISLCLVVVLDYFIFDAWTYALYPILIMTYGDGLSALIGKRYPSLKIFQNKTIYGTMTMFFVSLLIGFIVLSSIWVILLIAISATLIELFSPRGFDNLTVPVFVYVLLYIL